MTGHVYIWEYWLAALITFGIYSFLYSDNRLYRILFNTMIGLNVGYSLVLAWTSTLKPLWWDPMIGGFHALASPKGIHAPGASGALWVIIGILGILWYFQLSRKYMWLSRIVIGMTVGAGAGIVFKTAFLGQAAQITDSFRPLLSTKPSALWSNGAPLMGSGGHLDWITSINNTIFVGTIVCVMVYFFFSFSHSNKMIGGTAKVGRWLLMITFGAMFGNTVMTRMAVFLQRLQFLIDDWGQKAVPNTPWFCYLIGGALLLLIIGAYFIFRKPPTKPTDAEEIDGVPTPEIPAGERADFS